ncbi:hypothetical protein [Catellatospora vulcania]|uniref:hypothetical protein n=1 Tax=Catellatospora vulcania TaxID=1460450 RepID=UPI0012D39DB4|nr:hypothetical protein [Catellatospora vulcania]
MAIVRRLSVLSLNAEPARWRGRVILRAARGTDVVDTSRAAPKCPMDTEVP